MHILVVEDNKDISRNIKDFLEGRGFAVTQSFDGEDAQFQVLEGGFDVVVLDLGLPYKSGFEVLKSVRDEGVTTPIIVLTAFSSIDKKIEGLNLGADDYLTKPFAMEELLARVNAVIRRSAGQPSPVVNIKGLEVNPSAHKASYNGQLLDIPAKEFAVLEFLVRNKGNVVTRSMILDHVWGSDFETLSNVVDVYINNLRTKLKNAGMKEAVIETIRGKGYVIRDE